MSTSLVSTPRFNAEQIAIIKRTICKGATDDDLNIFLHQCERTGLDPFSKQIYAIMRKQKQKDGTYKEVMSLQTSIDGYRLIAQRSGEYTGQDGPYWCGEDGVWTDIWLSEKNPVASKVGVMRSGFVKPLYAVAKFSSYAQYGYDNKLTKFWDQMPEVMISKVAESLALRKAFPQELSGLYTKEEMDQADKGDVYDVSYEEKPVASPTVSVQASKKTSTVSDVASVIPEVPMFSSTNPEHVTKVSEFLKKRGAGLLLNQLVKRLEGKRFSPHSVLQEFSVINPEAPDKEP